MAQALGVATTTLLAWEEGTVPRPHHAARYKELLNRLERLEEAA
jgi:DNA-binding XRE family transcriptional regulator